MNFINKYVYHFQIFTFFCLLAVAQSIPEAKPTQPTTSQQIDNPKKRQTTSYTTNIVHDTTKDGKNSQSTISVKFGDNKNQQHLQLDTPLPPKKEPTKLNIHPTPKTIAHYAQDRPKPILHAKDNPVTKPGFIKPAQDTGYLSDQSLLAPLLVQNHGAYLENFGNKAHLVEEAHFPLQTPIYQAFHQPHEFTGKKNPQLFNVGYSINIMNHEPKLQYRLPNPPKRQPKRINNDNIITGSHKDTVGKPSELNLYPSYQPYHVPAELNEPISSPIKDQIRLYHHDSVEPNNAYVWKSLGPGVEISGFLSEEEQSQKFDHAAALGRSEGFDISNVIETDNKIPLPTLKSGIQTLPNLDFDKSFYDQFYKSLRQGPPQNLFKPELSLPPSPVRVGYLKSPPSFDNLPINLPVNFDQKLFPGFNFKETTRYVPKYTQSPIPPQEQHVALAQPPQKLIQPQYQIHENVNEGPPPKENFRQGRFVMPVQYRPVAQPYRMRVYPREAFQHQLPLRPPPYLFRVPKYVQ